MRLRVKKAFFAAIAAAMFVSLPHIAVKAESTSAKAHILMEVSTGRVFDEYNADEKLPMASTTKILTGLLAAENCNLDEIVTVPKEATGIEGTSMYLVEGETLPVRDLLYGLMLSSGNDAAAMLAIHMGGSIEGFAEMMNKRAKEAGATNSSFVTPNGLPNDNHYTTARDLAKIACAAMQNETFREVVGTSSLNIPEDDDSPARYLRSKNKILYEYDGGNGVKTGFTKAAGKCLVASAERDGMNLVAVTLNDYSMFNDCKRLLDYGFTGWKMQTVAEQGDSVGYVTVANGIKNGAEIKLCETIVLPLSEEEVKMVYSVIHKTDGMQAPVNAGDKAGYAEFYLGNEKLAVSGIEAADSIEENTYLYNLKKVLEKWYWYGEWGSGENSEIHGGGRSGIQTGQ